GTDSGVSIFGTITAGAGGVYRLGSGGATLFLGGTNVLGVTGTGGAILGDTRLGGTGATSYGEPQGYSGNTTINAGSTLNINPTQAPANNAGLSTNWVPANQLNLNGGTFAILG